LVVTEDLRTAERIAKTLKPERSISLSGICPDLTELVAHLQTEPARAVVVDLGGNPSEALRQLQPIIGRFHDSRFTVLADTADSQLMMMAMEVGARYFLTQDSLETDVVNVLKRLRQSRSEQDEWGGAVITILSSGGGCGATTIAVNLASELNLMSTRPVLLADMDYAYGTVATYLDLAGRYGIADVLARSDDVDQALVRSSALTYSEGLDVLISPAGGNGELPALQTDPEQMDRVLNACKDAYTYCVIDAPRISMDLAVLLARSSAKTFIVLQPQVKDVRIGRRVLRTLTDEGVPVDRISLLVNRFRQRRNALLGLSEARDAIGDVAIECVNNDYDSAVSAINYGQPLSVAAPKSPLRRDLQHLADGIIGARRAGAS